MEQELHEAGIDTTLVRLNAAADDCVRLTKGDTEKALVPFTRLLREDGALLVYIARLFLESKVKVDSETGCREATASQTNLDVSLAITPSSNAAETEHKPAVRGSPAKVISARSAARVANSVYDKRIGTNDLTLRKARLVDIANAERAGSSYTALMTLLRTRKKWPSKDACVPDVYTEREVKVLIDEARDSMPPVPLEVRYG